MKYKLADIKIGVRQRIDMGDISELADSMRRLGQIHSIGLHPDGTLIWGMRRHLAAKELGWEEIEAVVRDGLNEADAQEIELEEDIRRKDRTWQEECLALSKLFSIKARQARKEGLSFGVREMAAYSGFGKSFVADYVFTIGSVLAREPKDVEIWDCANYSDALDKIRDRREKEAYLELMKRNTSATSAVATIDSSELKKAIAVLDKQEQKQAIAAGGSVHRVDTTLPTEPRVLTLRDRAMLYTQTFSHLGPPNTPMFYVTKDGREFIHSFWFVGGGNISSFYGSYQIEYLKRIQSLFPDCKGKRDVVHLFSGSIPICDDYTVVGLPDNDGHMPDVVCDAHNLSSGLGFSPRLIYADPPYSVEDSEHYNNAMVNRAKVLSECATVLQPGGFVVWIDQALPTFSNDELQFVGAIGYIRSTGNRFRIVSIFRKPLCQNTTSSNATLTTKSPNPTAS